MLGGGDGEGNQNGSGSDVSGRGLNRERHGHTGCCLSGYGTGSSSTHGADFIRGANPKHLRLFGPRQSGGCANGTRPGPGQGGGCTVATRAVIAVATRRSMPPEVQVALHWASRPRAD